MVMRYSVLVMLSMNEVRISMYFRSISMTKLSVNRGLNADTYIYV